jgi:hypothetical protein
MSYDPCAGHQCDRCEVCRSGVCCSTVPTTTSTVVSHPDDLTILREAILEDPQGRSRLTALLLEEAHLHQTTPAAVLSESTGDCASRPAEEQACPELPAPSSVRAEELLDLLAPPSQQRRRNQKR